MLKKVACVSLSQCEKARNQSSSPLSKKHEFPPSHLYDCKERLLIEEGGGGVDVEMNSCFRKLALVSSKACRVSGARPSFSVNGLFFLRGVWRGKLGVKCPSVS